MATNTPIYAFFLPTVGGDVNAWGTMLNDNFTDLDSIIDTLNNAAVKLTGTQTIAGAKTFTTQVTLTALNLWLNPASGNANVQLGAQSVASTPFIDFRSSGLAPGFDSRIIASGGDGSNENGTLTYRADTHAFIGSITGTIDNATTAANCTRDVIGGNGLINAAGGNQTLTGNITLALGTPESITATSGNTTSADGHTHALGSGDVRTLLAEGLFGQIGTYALAYATTAYNHDITRAGSALNPASSVSSAVGVDGSVNANLTRGATTLAGTWRSMGRNQSGTANSVGLWLRIS